MRVSESEKKKADKAVVKNVWMRYWSMIQKTTEDHHEKEKSKKSVFFAFIEKDVEKWIKLCVVHQERDRDSDDEVGTKNKKEKKNYEKRKETKTFTEKELSEYNNNNGKDRKNVWSLQIATNWCQLKAITTFDIARESIYNF